MRPYRCHHSVRRGRTPYRPLRLLFAAAPGNVVAVAAVATAAAAAVANAAAAVVATAAAVVVATAPDTVAAAASDPGAPPARILKSRRTPLPWG